jgi:hypothetical protein
LKGYLRAWNVSGARSVGDSGANALCFITSEKLARFAKGFSVVVGKSKKKFNTIDDIYEDADEEEEGAILRVNDALIESCVKDSTNRIRTKTRTVCWTPCLSCERSAEAIVCSNHPRVLDKA